MRAIISVYDKKGIVEFAGKLKEIGWEIISTGGTGKILENAGIKVIDISRITSTPEMLGGRVKTLHPNVFGGILARDDQMDELKKYGICSIDLVCCNLYPFAEAVKKYSNEAEILENIDIGGVTLLRAAAKNYKKVIVVSDHADYDDVIAGIISADINRKYYALKAFKVTSDYDIAISRYFSGDIFDFDDEINIIYKKTADLRYGENPHQKAALYGEMPYRKIQGEKELSFNNIQDIDAAFNIVKSFTDSEPAAVIIKHAVPCGAALGESPFEAYSKALATDPMSAFGGIVALNRKFDTETANEIIKHFFEVIIAPDWTDDVLKILSQKKNLRVCSVKKNDNSLSFFSGANKSEEKCNSDKDYKKVSGGFLVQDNDSFDGEKWEAVTDKKPTPREMKDLKFAWQIVRFLKSNAIVIAEDSQARGLGGGETARVKAVEIAVSKMRQFFGDKNNQPVMASDGFFPFPDAIEKASEANISSIVQPGGSKNDSKVIEKANELGIAMVFTGRRHFLH